MRRHAGGRVDAQDRFWFAEYTGDRTGMLDTRTETFQERPLRQYSTPYAASVPDKNGYVYASSNMAERVLRLDPKTSEVIEYQIPTDFDSKEILHRSGLVMRDRRLVGHAKVPRRDLRHSSLAEALTAEAEVRGATDSCETR